MITKDDIEGLIFYFDNYDYDHGDLSVGEVDSIIDALQYYKENNYIAV